MKTIEKRASEYSDMSVFDYAESLAAEKAYIQGAEDQQKIMKDMAVVFAEWMFEPLGGSMDNYFPKFKGRIEDSLIKWRRITDRMDEWPYDAKSVTTAEIFEKFILQYNPIV